MKALVTGGAGFIGSHLVEALVKRGDTVFVVDNLSTGTRENLAAVADSIQFHDADLCEPGVATRVVTGMDVVFHLAALSSVPLSMEQPGETAKHNVLATVNVLDAAMHHDIHRIVYASSSSVYGGHGPYPQVETSTPSPESPYAAAKLSCEIFVRMFAHVFGLDTVSLRYFNVYGPRQRLGRYPPVIPAFISRMLHGKALQIWGDGLQTRDFTYVSDVVDATLLAGDRKVGFAGTVINVGAGQQTDLCALVDWLGDSMGVLAECEYHAQRPGDARDTLADLTRARSMLSYGPQICLRDGLQRTVDYYQGCVSEGNPDV